MAIASKTHDNPDVKEWEQITHSEAGQKMSQATWQRMSGALSRLTGNTAKPANSGGGFTLVRAPTTLQNIKRIEQHLPEILGRALARGWIDRNFAEALLADPKRLLSNYDVFLPENIKIEVETTEAQRQRIVVYEHRPNGDKHRVMYLQLVMMAGK